MKLYLVTEEGEPRWIAALLHEKMYGFVADTGMFHDNNALRNDYYIDREFDYEEIGTAEARRLVAAGVGQVDEVEEAEVLAVWRADPSPIPLADVLSMAAGSRGD
ncbi:hypothetical protein AB0E69_22835 [Kribbella sp. NPDC026611]|uniref:hypothetical protein n=1 Tax=Kribbella sp. NPDC026611 TaxID=3154911 RepID=UPI0033F4456C